MALMLISAYGGQGANQSVARSESGCQVSMLGAIHYNDQAIIKH